MRRSRSQTNQRILPCIITNCDHQCPPPSCLLRPSVGLSLDPSRSEIPGDAAGLCSPFSRSNAQRHRPTSPCSYIHRQTALHMPIHPSSVPSQRGPRGTYGHAVRAHTYTHTHTLTHAYMNIEQPYTCGLRGLMSHGLEMHTWAKKKEGRREEGGKRLFRRPVLGHLAIKQVATGVFVTGGSTDHFESQFFCPMLQRFMA